MRTLLAAVVLSCFCRAQAREQPPVVQPPVVQPPVVQPPAVTPPVVPPAVPPAVTAKPRAVGESSGRKPQGGAGKQEKVPAGSEVGGGVEGRKVVGGKNEGAPAAGSSEAGESAGGKDAGEPGIEKAPADQPIPAGYNAQDIAAMRSAQAMLEAERKLAEQIKAGKIKGLDKIVTFDELSSWPYEDGLKGMPESVKALDGKKVLMTGFMLPIDEVQNIKEFLLVQSLWSCCYGQPPDINGIVRVVMPKGKTADYFFDPLKVTGRLKIEAAMLDGYVVDIYQLHLESLEVIK
ncbi:MAG: hypothetical protein Fur0037_06450 [Planctomycetota bacterium]